MLRKFFLILSLMLISASSFGGAIPSSPEEYIRVFRTATLQSQIDAAKSLAVAGLSSEEIFDVVEKNVNKYVFVAKDDPLTVQYVVWLTKALSFSGNEKYRKTIENIEKSGLRSSIKRHASIALEDLIRYKLINETIAPTPWKNNIYPEKTVRLINMIESDFSELQLKASIDIYENRNYKNEVILALRKKVEENYLHSLSGEEIDAVAWMCKALASSKMPEQLIFLKNVEKSAKEKQLKKYVKSYVNKFQS
jgi:hypothetical protein